MILHHPCTPMPDPRDPPTRPEPYFPVFQRELASTEQLRVLAAYLAHVHWLFEGWGTCPQPLSPPQHQRYARHAAYAVRACSEAYQASAMTCAEHFAVDAFETLLKDLRSTDATPERREARLKRYAHEILQVRDHQLAVGCGRSALEWREYHAADADAMREDAER